VKEAFDAEGLARAVLRMRLEVSCLVEREVVAASAAPEPDGSGPREALTSGVVVPSSESHALPEGGFLQSCEVRAHGEAANLSPGPPAAKKL
jgi:hypothetical protein